MQKNILKYVSFKLAAFQRMTRLRLRVMVRVVVRGCIRVSVSVRVRASKVLGSG